MKTKTKEKKKFSKSELLEKVKALFEKYLDTTGAIIDEDVIIEDGTRTELKAADENFLGNLEELIDDNEETTVDEVVYFLDNNNDLESDDIEKILTALPMEEIVDFTETNGYVAIKVDGMTDRDKLNEFVRNNIYPYNCNPERELFF